MKLSKLALISAIAITANATPAFVLTERDVRNQGHPQPVSKRGKFKRRNRKGK